MKAAFVVAAAIAVVAAQDLPACGNTCIDNMKMIMQNATYGCPNDPACFCCKRDFAFGVIDCSNQLCGNAELATSAILYAASYCTSALPQTSVCTSYTAGSGQNVGGAMASGSGVSSAGIGASGSGSSTPATVSASVTGIAGIGGIVAPISSGAAGYSIAGTTLTAGGPEATTAATEYTVLSNGDIVATASGFTTTYASGDIEAAAAAAQATANSNMSSGVSGASGAMMSSQASNSGNSGMSGMSGMSASSTMMMGGSSTAAPAAGGSTSSGGAVPMKTAAPVMMGAAALALLAL